MNGMIVHDNYIPPFDQEVFCSIHEQDLPCIHCLDDEMDRRYDEQRDRGAQ